MTPDDAGSDLSIEELREKYATERAKRLRPDANAQYKELAGEYEEFDVDPYADAGFVRDARDEDVEVVIVGAGFAGMMAAINLTKLGVRDFRIVEKAGD